MPSARIHEVIAKKINEEYNMDELLLRIGTVAPDCWRNSKISTKHTTHFWDFSIKEGQANNYNEFYNKYCDNISNPVYFGYLIHLITDQYWKTYIDPKFISEENGNKVFKTKDGKMIKDENYFGYNETKKVQKMLAQKYELEKFPIKKEDILNFECEIEELDLNGLFGENGTLNYINKTYSGDSIEESIVFDFDDIINSIDETVDYIKKELEKLNIKIYKKVLG
ncbi:MAG: hypothetical protein E7170_03585 [Firmicutes bacterium]|nr:hypothetical protein [Bacillota bacterium]